MTTRRKRRSRRRTARFVVVTGLSGAGKSQAIRALEDLGYYCVDNLPVSLLPVMAELAERQTEHNRVAVVMDIREPRFVSDFPRAYRKLKTIGEACRAIVHETLRSTLTWAIERVEVYAWDKDRVVAHLGLTGDG